MRNSVNGSYCQADVICLIYFGWQMLLPRGRWYSSIVWQMLLPMIWQMFLPLQCIATILLCWCYCLVADGIATCCLIISFHGQMLLSCGRWNCQLYCCEAHVIAQWQMEWPLHGLRFSPGRCCSQGGRWIGYWFQFEFWGVMQNLIPYVRQMVLAYVLT